VKVLLNKDPQAITWKAFDPAHPAPDINTVTHNHFHTAPFGVLLNDEVCRLFCKGIQPHKFLRLMGEPSNLHLDKKWTDDQLYDRMKWRVPTTTLRWATQTLFLSDHDTIGPMPDSINTTVSLDKIPVLLNRANIIERTTLPLPTNHQWQQAVTQDHDLKRIAEALNNNTPLKKDSLIEKSWFKEWTGAMTIT
jgi:hypothetical protein